MTPVNPTMHHLGKHLHFTSDSAGNAMQHESLTLSLAHFVEIGGSSTPTANGLHISVIHSFCESMRATIESRPDQPIIVCPEHHGVRTVSNACQLCGAFLILCEGATLDRVLSAFKHALQGFLPPRRTAIVDCWAALHRARTLGWLGNADDEHEPALDVEMACHYALACNGGVHVLVPGKLLLFPSPGQLPADQAWVDVSEPGRPTARRFSAAFLAALLADLGVSAAACLGRTCGSDAAAWRAGGLDVHDLALDARRPALLGAMDRLLAVSRAAPGATALFPGRGCDADPAGEALPECAGTLAAAWLMTDFGFCSGAAAAWINMLCPGLLA